jgi:hypothetical protein
MRERAVSGLARLARDLGVDKANLLKVIKGERKPAKALVGKIQGLIRTTTSRAVPGASSASRSCRCQAGRRIALLR